MGKIYKKEAVEDRINQTFLEAEERLSEDNDGAMTYKTVCCNPMYSKATLVGCGIGIL